MLLIPAYQNKISFRNMFYFVKYGLPILHYKTNTCMAYKCILVLAKLHNSITRFQSLGSIQTAKLVCRFTYRAIFCQPVSINFYWLLYYF
jgi:hypothetical protein